LKGQPVQVVEAKDDHLFELNEEALSEILMNPNVRDKKVVVLSVAGAFRKGKSFFLDFCLRYLNAYVSIISFNSADWLGDEDSPLDGFPWRGGAERDTTGILLWSEPFTMTIPETGEEVVVLLMDTQGAFDSLSTVKDCATVFALSQLLSSVQVFNIMLNIQEDDLQHLQLFTEYGRLAMEDSNAKPFQDLHFFVRDWQYPYEHDYGNVGGQELIDKRLKIVEGQHSELEQLRRHIRSCFHKIGCYLMPHPGLKVATNPYFDGRLSDITPEFKEHLKKFIPALLSADKLIVKEINGSKITCRELLEYFKAYLKMYQGDEIPEPKSMLIATAEANNLSAVANSKEHYIKEMEEVICGGNRPYVNPEILLSQHVRFKDSAIKMFDTCRKMGGTEFSASYRQKLDKEIAEQYEYLIKHNESKNVLAAAKTPAVLFCTIVAFYFLNGVMNIIHLTPLANLSNLIMLIAIGVLSVWVYTRYTGEMRELGESIDDLASALWENVSFTPFFLIFYHKILRYLSV
ncbi:hypothetical protein HELRODRAFT_73066, partial [Helobdella robusta]